MAILLKHQTLDQFGARIRALYRDGTPEERVKIARFITTKIQATELTDAQVRGHFNLTATQWNALKTRMTNLVNAKALLENSVGE